MLKVAQMKLPVSHTEADLKKRICRELRIRENRLLSYQIVRRSIDARKKPDLSYVYTVSAKISDQASYLEKKHPSGIVPYEEKPYIFPESGEEELCIPPVVVGSGPAGLFAAYELALHGYAPLLIERGSEARKRREKVDRFWKEGILDPECNVQFGEGGAGTFSDGKLNTGVKDKYARSRRVLEIFAENGAPQDILIDARPHLGTDLLVSIVQSIRNKILENGGQVLFDTKMTGIDVRDGKVTGIRIVKNGCQEKIPVQVLVLAIGHSARDTFEMLTELPLLMEQKPFAVGVRCEHPQELINLDQYGVKESDKLGPAPYKLTHNFPDGRGVYSFCMCPGGYVVNASSEEGMLAVNGMSYSGRDSDHANSAIVVSVGPKDFAGYADGRRPEILSGMFFQRELEKAAFRLGEGDIPVQRFEDFCLDRQGSIGPFLPCMKGKYRAANVRRIFPEELAEHLHAGICAFDRKIKGFAGDHVLLSGVESRTSSPIRIVRDDSFQSSILGLYPAGEGAGYAGGITSAAMDGMKTAEAIAKRFRKPGNSICFT
ncbi:MAG: NAD(P)-binding protein [Eubacterium sp.]|nr:NAD(P)-binding protein [Eubacterium sp.]